MERLFYNALVDALNKSESSEMETTLAGRVTIIPDKRSFIQTLKQTFRGVPLADSNGAEYQTRDFTDDDVRLLDHPMGTLAFPERSKLMTWFNEIAIRACIFDEKDLRLRYQYEPQFDMNDDM
jgi:hypothetical protein